MASLHIVHHLKQKIFTLFSIASFYGVFAQTAVTGTSKATNPFPSSLVVYIIVGVFLGPVLLGAITFVIWASTRDYIRVSRALREQTLPIMNNSRGPSLPKDVQLLSNKVVPPPAVMSNLTLPGERGPVMPLLSDDQGASRSPLERYGRVHWQDATVEDPEDMPPLPPPSKNRLRLMPLIGNDDDDGDVDVIGGGGDVSKKEAVDFEDELNRPFPLAMQQHTEDDRDTDLRVISKLSPREGLRLRDRDRTRDRSRPVDEEDTFGMLPLPSTTEALLMPGDDQIIQEGGNSDEARERRRRSTRRRERQRPEDERRQQGPSSDEGVFVPVVI
mmetsp:Transcript_37619/g.60947  ORF Transcript_37619/g.60947 Transcript_37619/m.60947 type:complete len:330 (-) Transcript_37619:750-1739(-)|eukprot:CAMPEP_0184676594 /NCGR_PEP_ID=MMETSP0308-20130426/88433_1 /TAXON_ID=38269 /ORGANISM="Gloeochaete witrockiana, Strain SAG 46.84" /LENGTH=329 /DNA_ID=CAMNT_0027124435 /DNA_START=213 /DNA_END=1202 /DNA_ORIENTATION=-